MNIKLLNPEVQEYIHKNISTKLHEFALKKSPFKEISSLELTIQLQGKKIAKKKLPFLFNQKNILYPIHLSLEQSSSQDVAYFKSTLFKGNSALDLSLGFGIDAFFISNNFQNFVGIEPNQELIKIVEHNFLELNKNNLKFINSSAEIFLNQNKQKFDLIYLDPDRRKKENKKNIIIEDLSPNILEIKEQILNFSNLIIIKLSPLIDLKSIIYKLKNIQQIYLIAQKNELKEVLIVLKNNENLNPEIKCINLNSDDEIFTFNYQDEQKISIFEYDFPQKYVYFPNVSILKSNGYKSLSQKYKLKKLDVNTHIFTSNEIINFPGNCFEVTDYKIDISKIKKTKANLISKNYPLETIEIKKKYQIKDGGNIFYLFTKSNGKLIILELKKIN